MTDVQTPPERRRFSGFLTIWAGQTVSTIGSGLTGFALAVWLFQQTGNATPMAITALSQWVPRILLAPVAGIVADRFSRKTVMILADTGAALATAVGALLVSTGRLEVWHVYLIAAAIGTFGAFQAPAMTASVTLLVDKKHYARAAGMRQASAALEAIAAPVIAGMLMGVIGLAGIILVDLATFFAAVTTLFVVHVPNPEPSAADAEAVRPRGLRAAMFGLSYITARRGLLAMLLYFALVNFFANTASILLPPMVLSFSDAAGLGLVQTVGGIGMLAGSILIGIWGGPTRRMAAVYVAILVTGLGLVIASLHASLPVVAAGLFVTMALIPVASGSAAAIWQTKVDPAVQGRVFAARGMIATAMMPLAFGLSGPLADRVFQPMMHGPQGAPQLLTMIVGEGSGRGYAVILLIGGALLLAATVLFATYRPLRRVDEELPDFEEPEATVTVAAQTGTEAPLPS